MKASTKLILVTFTLIGTGLAASYVGMDGWGYALGLGSVLPGIAMVVELMHGPLA